MKKIITLLLLSICLLFSACDQGDEGIKFDDDSPAGSLSYGTYRVRYSLYQDGELIGETKTGGWLLDMYKVDDTHIDIQFRATNFEPLSDIYIYIYI